MPSTTGVRSGSGPSVQWNSSLERMEAGDSREEAQALRAQLEHLLPTVWGGGAVRPNTGPVPQQNSPGRIKNHLSLVSPGLANRLK